MTMKVLYLDINQKNIIIISCVILENKTANDMKITQNVHESLDR